MSRRPAEDRRAPGIQRVPIATLVEICGQDGAVPAFEAESCNVSGLGMQVRTSYLPEIGDELVCRFEHEGKEILVEGRVAWRSEGKDGGEFGVQFTALDAGSVDVLQQLGAPELPAAEEELDAPIVPRAGAEPGAKVRLHIEGLGAPMKARVQEGNPRKVRVGSNLEFLKVGRSLEIEDVQAGMRQGAHIDSVSVAVNPSTKVPELVVVLRYEGVDATPEPSVVATEDAREEDPGLELEAALDAGDDGTEGSGWLAGVERFRRHIEGLARGASHAARHTQGMLGRVAGSAAEGASKLARGAGAHLARTQGAERKRRTAAPPVAVRSSVQALKGTSRREAASGMRRQSARSARAAGDGALESNKRKLLILGAAAVLVSAGSAYAFRSLGDGSAPPALSQVATHERQASDAALGDAPPKAEAAARPAAPAPTSRSDDNEVVAEVPLFGPKAMATAEPAPLGVPEKVDTAQMERLAAAAAVEDETWEEEKPAAATTPADVKPWGRGKLHLPTIHRIRLDAPGTQLAGAMEPTGFTVVIPGRKAMEEGRNIEKRDKRIAQVKASNTDRGASITFKFRGTVPAYRVRLRKDFVEFFISAPEGEAAKL